MTAGATRARVPVASGRAGGDGNEFATRLRVLGVTASGPDLAMAIENAYQGVRAIHFEGMHYRTDIGAKGLRRYNKVNAGT